MCSLMAHVTGCETRVTNTALTNKVMNKVNLKQGCKRGAFMKKAILNTKVIKHYKCLQ